MAKRGGQYFWLVFQTDDNSSIVQADEVDIVDGCLVFAYERENGSCEWKELFAPGSWLSCRELTGNEARKEVSVVFSADDKMGR